MLPYDTRPHRWVNGSCVTCGMRSSWEGARYACTGVSAHVKQVGGGRPKGSTGTCSHCGSPEHNRRRCPEKPQGRLTDAEYARRYRERHKVEAAPTTHACGICGKTWTREPKCGRMPLYCSVRCTRRAHYLRSVNPQARRHERRATA